MSATTDNNHRQPVELADVFRLHGDLYCANNTLTPEQYKVINAIKNCRTSVLGGHVEQCNHCAVISCAYNSCRNRHCPKCETFKATKWLKNREAELLPVSYFHVVFTLPHELNNLVLYNKKILYNLLFQTAWETIRQLGADPKRLNGEMGMLAILHTWSQNLLDHNHAHCIVPGGALQKNYDWVDTKNYLFPVKVMSKLFRGAFVCNLRSLYKNQELKLPDQLTAINFEKLLKELMAKDWVVYSKKPFIGPETLLNYLGRYTHKIAISNHRIIACDQESVTFKWRDYADGSKEKIMTLKAPEFIRRFLLHVVPHGFMRIRGFGFLANACKKKKLKIIQKALNHKPLPKGENKDSATLMLELTGKDITLCPQCKIGKLMRIEKLLPKLNNMIFDTS